MIVVLPAGRPARGGPGVLMVLVALACLLVLLLPLEGEGHSWPHYSHVTVNQKLIAAFALGTSIYVVYDIEQIYISSIIIV